MSQTQSQPQQKSQPSPTPSRIARITFVNAVSFAGTIESASVDPGPAVVSRLGSGIDIKPATMTPNGPRELSQGESFDGFLLSKAEMDRTKSPPVKTMRVAFVGKENVKEVTLNAE